MHARIQIYWCRSSIFRHLKLELLTQFPAPNDEKYINVVYIWRKFVSFYGYVHWRMTTGISVMYGSEKVKLHVLVWWYSVHLNMFGSTALLLKKYIKKTNNKVSNTLKTCKYKNTILFYYRHSSITLCMLMCFIWFAGHFGIGRKSVVLRRSW